MAGMLRALQRYELQLWLSNRLTFCLPDKTPVVLNSCRSAGSADEMICIILDSRSSSVGNF